MHPSDPDSTHAGAFFALDGDAIYPDPGFSEPALRVGDEYARIDPPDPVADPTAHPPLPQSCAEAAAHCLHLLESMLAEECVRVAWAAAEGLVAAARAEMREACAKVAEDWGWSDKPDHAHGIAEAIRAMPLEVPR
jgi:hypothetical protein